MGYTGTGNAGTIYTANGNGVGPNFQPASTVGGGATNVNLQVFSSSGTYTPSIGMRYCIVEVIGGGGGGGGCSTTNASQCSAGAGGGAGGYSRKVLTSSSIGVSQAVTIGSGGTGGAAGNNTGNPGGTTSFGSIFNAGGGQGGQGASTNFANFPTTPGQGGGGSLGDINASGSPGLPGWQTLQGSMSGTGGSSFLGGGAISVCTFSFAAGANAASFGGGGSGAAAIANGTAEPGGNGFPGVIFVTEFINASTSGGPLTWQDANSSFSAIKTTGYFVTATLTATLPASPLEGDTIAFIVDGSFILTIQTSTGQRIQIGSARSSVSGFATSSLTGDSVTLVYRSTDSKWMSQGSPDGIWGVN